MPNVRNCPKILGQRKGQGRYDKSGKKAPAAAVAATPAHAHKAEVVAEVDSNAVDYDEGAGEEAPVEAGGKCGGEVEAVGEKVAVMASRKRDGVDVGFISTRLLACNSSVPDMLSF